MYAERRKAAIAFLKRYDEFVIDSNIFGWPWRPFQQPSDEELKHRKRQEAMRVLRHEDDAERRIAAAEQLLELGGWKEWDTSIELEESGFVFWDNFERVGKFESLQTFQAAFTEHVKDWKGDQPDWQSLQYLLVDASLVSVTELKDLTLIDIRRLLPHLSKRQREQAMGRGLPVNNVTQDGPVKPNSEGSVSSATRIISAIEQTNTVHTNRFELSDHQCTIVLDGHRVSLKRTSGAVYCRELMSRRGTIITADELYSLKSRDSVRLNFHGSQTDERIDSTAKKSLHENLKLLENKLSDAIEMRKDEEASQIQQEIEVITATLKRDIGLRGRSRPLTRNRESKTSENVRKRIRDFLNSVRKAETRSKNFSIVTHLETFITPEGRGWVYRPDREIEWEFS